MADTEFIKKFRDDAAKARQGVMEFQGFEREFRLYEKQLLTEFDKSDNIKHPGNLGSTREDILRSFFAANGLIPAKYGISERSNRVVSSSGHHSKEIDLLFYDKPNSVSLLKYESCEFFPVESVYGVIQVKSVLRNKSQVKEGLDNIASFKRLQKSGKSTLRLDGMSVSTSASKGFGILFAYRATLKWTTTIEAIEEFMKENPSSVWPNAIVILDEGLLIPFGEKRGYYLSPEVEKLTTPALMKTSTNDQLLAFYQILMGMLENTSLGPSNMLDYVRLPLTSGEISYSFSFSFLGESSRCDKHGPYLREIGQDALKKILDVCGNSEPINWIKATNIAYGLPDNPEAYKRQNHDVYIYNPDNAELKDILILPNPQGGLAFDSIEIRGKTYWIPYEYSIQDDLIPMECPTCKKARERKAK